MLTPFGSLPNPADLRMLTLRWNGEFGGQDAVKARCLMTVRYRAQFPEAQMDGYKVTCRGEGIFLQRCYVSWRCPTEQAAQDAVMRFK